MEEFYQNCDWDRELCFKFHFFQRKNPDEFRRFMEKFKKNETIESFQKRGVIDPAQNSCFSLSETRIIGLFESGGLYYSFGNNFSEKCVYVRRYLIFKIKDEPIVQNMLHQSRRYVSIDKKKDLKNLLPFRIVEKYVKSDEMIIHFEDFPVDCGGVPFLKQGVLASFLRIPQKIDDLKQLVEYYPCAKNEMISNHKGFQSLFQNFNFDFRNFDFQNLNFQKPPEEVRYIYLFFPNTLEMEIQPHQFHIANSVSIGKCVFGILIEIKIKNDKNPPTNFNPLKNISFQNEKIMISDMERFKIADFHDQDEDHIHFIMVKYFIPLTRENIFDIRQYEKISDVCVFDQLQYSLSLDPNLKYERYWISFYMVSPSNLIENIL